VWARKVVGSNLTFEHLSLKINLKFEDLMVCMMLANNIPIMSNWKKKRK
jgi:hypothetical protein